MYCQCLKNNIKYLPSLCSGTRIIWSMNIILGFCVIGCYFRGIIWIYKWIFDLSTVEMWRKGCFGFGKNNWTETEPKQFRFRPKISVSVVQSRSCNSLFPYVYFRITELWTSMVWFCVPVPFFSILVEDDAIKPISGHVLRVEAPWIKTTMAKGDAYIIPKYVHHWMSIT